MSSLRSALTRDVLIGRGHFGEVWKARDDAHGEVAVKIPIQRPEESDAAWERRKETLLREGERLSAAAHDNVVRVFTVLRDEITNTPWLVMELCEGGLMPRFEAGPMKLPDVRRVSSQVALGLRSLHARGMLHRDIKPGNILLSRRGVAQLGDFGLVTDDLVLGYGSMAGYSDHLAPEVWAKMLTSEKSDVWALGMTIYRLLHGKEWYSRLASRPAVVIANGGFADSLPWLPHVDARWRRVIRHMMHDHTDKRCQSAEQVLNALASLSCENDWDCAVEPHAIRWTREAKGRKFYVVRVDKSPRTCTWEAWSEPLGVGNRRKLGGSGGVVSFKQADAELRRHFNP